MVGAAPFLWVSWTTPAEDRDAQEDATRNRFLELLHTAEHHMKAGNAVAAAEVYREAEKLMPGHAGVKQLRLAAERQAKEQGDLTEIETKISGHLMEAQTALEAREYDNALAAVNAALALDAENPLAQEFLKVVRAEQAAMKKRADEARKKAPSSKAPQGVASTEPGAESTPATSTEPSFEPAPASQEATLSISFQSELGGANAMVWIGKKKIFQETVGERGRFGRRKGAGGRIERTAPVPAGDITLRVYVARPGQRAVLSEVDGNFTGGESRRLEIELYQTGPAAIRLR
jgi:hypothetical protein